MSSFTNTFYDRYHNNPNSTLLFKFNNIINYVKDNEYCCFVEGNTDPLFYSNLKNYGILNNIDLEKYIYLRKQEKIDGDNSGKQGVIDSYNYLFKNKNRNLKKCIFIVDHDYSGLENYKVPKNNGITMTKPYAFENYFLEDRNIKTIFNFYNISNHYDEFITKLNEFIKNIDDYNRLKSAITRYNHTGFIGNDIRYKKIYSDKDIFNFNFKKKDVPFNMTNMNKEIENMKKAVYTSIGAKSYYEYTTLKFSNKREWIKGHIIYDYLYNYLKQIHNIDLNNDYKKIVNMLDVDIEIKKGTGEVINNEN